MRCGWNMWNLDTNYARFDDRFTCQIVYRKLFFVIYFCCRRNACKVNGFYARRWMASSLFFASLLSKIGLASFLFYWNRWLKEILVYAISPCTSKSFFPRFCFFNKSIVTNRHLRMGRRDCLWVDIDTSKLVISLRQLPARMTKRWQTGPVNVRTINITAINTSVASK